MLIREDQKTMPVGANYAGLPHNGFEVLVLVAVAGAAALTVSAQQGPDPQVRARIDAFVSALTSGDAGKYEAMARDNFSPEFLAARSPEQRRQFLGGAVAIAFRKAQHRVLDDVERRLLVAHGENGLLEGAPLDAGEERRQFTSRCQ